MTKIEVSREAADFVRNETVYLRRRNKHAAQSFLDIIRRAKTVSATFDEAGNRMHGLQINGDVLSSWTPIFSIISVGRERSIS